LEFFFQQISVGTVSAQLAMKLENLKCTQPSISQVIVILVPWCTLLNNGSEQ